MKPRVSILSPEFKWTSSVHTDISKRFDRIRREQRLAAIARQRVAQEREEDTAVVHGIFSQRRKESP